MKKHLIIPCITICLLLSACAGKRTGLSYITVKDTQFMLNEEPYYFVGTNYWYGAYVGSAGKTGNRARLVRELDMMRNAGITNLRILAASERSDMVRSV